MEWGWRNTVFRDNFYSVWLKGRIYLFFCPENTNS